MYIQRLNYQVFPMKTSEAFQIWTKCVENKWEGNRVPLGDRKLDCTLTKDLKIIFQKLHKHSLIQNELVSTFTLKNKYQTILVS